MDTSLYVQVVKHAKEVLGFSDVGVVALNPDLYVYDSSNIEGVNAYNHLKSSTLEKYPWAESVIVFIRPHTPYKNSFPNGFGAYSAHYKQSPQGRKAVQNLAEIFEKSGCKATFDSGIPVKAAAFCAGMGKYGRNSLIYTKKYGSFITIHSVVTDAIIDSDIQTADNITDCGDCVSCISACPTNAISDNGRISSGQCVREYMLSRSIVPQNMREHISTRLLGCDICQIVCPMNKAIYEKAILPADDELVIFDIERILENTDTDELTEKIGDVIGANYAKHDQILSSAAIVAGNMKQTEYIPYLRKLLRYPNPSVRVHAAWALVNIDRKTAELIIEDVIRLEPDETVKLELENLRH